MKTKILGLFIVLTLSYFYVNAGTFKEYMQFKGTVGNENVVGAISMTDSKTYGTFSYIQGNFSSASSLYDLRCTSSKSLGQRKYKLNLNVELNGKNYGTWTVTYNAVTKRITGTMKNENGKTLKIDLYEWKKR